MSVFLTPNLNPIGGGTYYPPEDAYGRPGFKSILLHMANRVSFKYSVIISIKISFKLTEHNYFTNFKNCLLFLLNIFIFYKLFL